MENLYKLKNDVIVFKCGIVLGAFSSHTRPKYLSAKYYT